MNASAALLVVLLLWSSTAAADAPAGRPHATVYPSGASIPENLLRIELRFSTPLNGTFDMRSVRLLDADGREIADALLDLPLPAADGSRVAILLHPGRVKSDVGANLTLGRALHAGSKVTLAIDDPRLACSIRKSWQVVAADIRPPEPARWSFRPPAPDERSPLVVELDGPVDSSAAGLIAIRAPDGSRLAGTASLVSGETTWRFVPTQPWRPGRFAIVVHPELEDPAGNRVCRPFESEAASRADCAPTVARPFRVRAPSAFPPGELR